jgi:hypothetical protein
MNTVYPELLYIRNISRHLGDRHKEAFAAIEPSKMIWEKGYSCIIWDSFRI